jgi:hypothetical protein
MRLLPKHRWGRPTLAQAVTVAAVLAAGWFLLDPGGIRYRGRSAAWWAEELERGRNRNWVGCGAVPFPETLPAPLRRLIPVNDDEDGLALRLGDPAAVPVLLELLRHPHPKTRVCAAEGLWSIGRQAPDAIDALVGALRDEDGEVRSVAWRALRDVDPDVARRAGVPTDERNDDP